MLFCFSEDFIRELKMKREINFRIKQLRLENKLTQKQLAKEINSAQSVISNWETEKSQPSVAALIKLADVFDVSINYLVGFSDERKIAKK